MGFAARAKGFSTPEQMASAYLREKFGNEKIKYPINPFALLYDEGILFKLSDFGKLEGVYIPAASENDLPIVGINGNRPITRQRYTAAHELCHHFCDSNKRIACTLSRNNAAEQFAEDFAAALLMPMNELRVQVHKRKNSKGNVSFDDVLEIADFFGVSFLACLFRIAYKIHAIEGDTEVNALKKRATKYKPETVRKNRHLTYSNLYAELIDCYKDQLSFAPTDRARLIFQNDYIYNDSRMEGLEVTIEQASDIVTDLRLKTQHSEYCKEENEAFLSIAGHYDMYQSIFAEPVKDSISVYEMMSLNRMLFSYYPHPEFGGSIRQNNTLVLGAKFEAVDYHDIYTELAQMDEDVRRYYAKQTEMAASDYIKHIVRTHHRIAVIHPFSDGNGRTARAFMNIQLVRAKLPPIYIKVEEKEEYLAALSRADKYGDYDKLYEIIFRSLLRSHIELTC